MITTNCIKCNKDTGATWKTLCINCWKNKTPDEIRAYRQAKLDKKVARLNAKAEKLDQIAENKQSEYNSYKGDIAFFTQPAQRGSSFSNQRERIYKKYDAGIKLSIEADDLRSKAEWLESQKARVKGDAEAARQLVRDKADSQVTVGSKVVDYLFGEGTVTRVNKKSYTIKFESGGTYARDKSYIKL